MPTCLCSLTPLGVVLGRRKISSDRRSITAGGGTVTTMAQTQRLVHLGHHSGPRWDGALGSWVLRCSVCVLWDGGAVRGARRCSKSLSSLYLFSLT